MQLLLFSTNLSLLTELKTPDLMPQAYKIGRITSKMFFKAHRGDRFISSEQLWLGDKAAALTGLRVGLRKGRNTDSDEKKLREDMDRDNNP